MIAKILDTLKGAVEIAKQIETQACKDYAAARQAGQPMEKLAQIDPGLVTVARGALETSVRHYEEHLDRADQAQEKAAADAKPSPTSAQI